MTLKIGLMGCGNVADYGHLPAMQRVDGYGIHALFDINAQRVAQIADKFGVPHACTDEAAFFDSGIDAVVVTSAAPAHEANVLAAAKRGLPVLCEKPLAMDEEQAQHMIDAMRKADAGLFVSFCYRFSPAALRIKELVGEGAIGDVRSLRLIYNWDNHGKYLHRDHLKGEPNPSRVGRMLEGGPMVDCGVHQIDLAQWWLGSGVTRARGEGAWVDEFEAPDHMWAHLTHENGAHTMVEMSYSFGHTMRDAENSFVYQLIGTQGVITYDRNISRFELRNQDGTFPQQYHEEKNFEGAHRAFAHFLNTGDPGELCTAEQGQEATRIARTITDDLIAEHSAK